MLSYGDQDAITHMFSEGRYVLNHLPTNPVTGAFNQTRATLP
jgi:hypothetical protein